MPELTRTVRPGRLPALRAGKLAPGMALAFPRQPTFVLKYGVKNPGHQQSAHREAPTDFPDFPGRAHSWPQMLFKWSTPRFKSSTGTPGFISNTLMCPGCT